MLLCVLYQSALKRRKSIFCNVFENVRECIVVLLCLVGLLSFLCCSEGRRIIHFYVPFNESYLLTIPRGKNSVGVSFCTDAQIYQNCLSAVKGAWKCEKTEDEGKEF